MADRYGFESELVVIVTGSRIWNARKVLWGALDFHKPTLVVHGAAHGADLMAEAWAKQASVDYLGMPAKWRKRALNSEGTVFDASGGFRRNDRMLKTFRGATVLAFPEGEARGTRDCMARAQRLGHPLWVYDSTGEIVLKRPGASSAASDTP